MTFKKVIGTGGIGSGVIYRLESNRALGRNESRMAYRQDQQDFCKLHIILHYVSVLLRDLKRSVPILPIGAVGEDDVAVRILKLMQTAGMDVRYVASMKGTPTLFSTCYQFPDGAGGNLTEANSASEKVTPRLVARIGKELQAARGQCMVLAAPEVPMASRITLLELGRKYGACNAASFVTDELLEVKKRKLLGMVDILSVNIEEAALLGGISPESKSDRIVDACTKRVTQLNTDIRLAVTDGPAGAYGIEGGKKLFLRNFNEKVENAAGAGDAFLGGLMIGTVLGLPFISRDVASSLHLARAIANMKVRSPHTISFDVNLRSLRAFASERKQTRLRKALE